MQARLPSRWRRQPSHCPCPSRGTSSSWLPVIDIKLGFQLDRTNHQTQRVRPLFACAILRNLKFTPRSYASFIDLQDKLHQNIGRRRWLVSIGTHDLDSIEPPFRYEARDPDAIKFVPLTKKEAYTAKELMTVYEVLP